MPDAPVGRVSRIEDNRSVWWASASERTPRPHLSRDLDCDVAVIGGGFTGVSTAYRLAQRYPERRIVLCEAHRLANGASGRSGGLVLNWDNSGASADLELTRRIFDTTRGAIDALEALTRQLGPSVAFRRTGALEVLTDARRAERAAREVERLAAVGIPLRFLDGRELRALTRLEGAAGAILDPTAGHLDGVSFLHAMRDVLVDSGVHLFEGTPVLGIEEGATHTLVTPEARVRAKALVLATNAYTPRLGYFRSSVVPLHSHVLATEPLAVDTWEKLGWSAGVSGFSDDQGRLGYASMSARGELVFGGGSNAAYTYRFGNDSEYRGQADRAFEAIEDRLHRYLPRLATHRVRVAHRWTGTLALTLNRVCTMGVRGRHRNVFFALGYSGHGITLANLAGSVITDLYSGDDARWRGLPFFQNRLPFVPPEPFRWLGYKLYTSLTGRSPRRG